MIARAKKIFVALTAREKIVFFSAAAAAAASGLALAGIVLAASTVMVPTHGGEYAEGFAGQPVYVNPVIASTDIDKSLVRLVFSSVGGLADKITASEDGRTWNVRLKENLHWQDEMKLTSDDVVFTVQKIQDRESRSPLYDAWQGAAAERVSELEIKFSLINPYAFFGDTLRGLYVLPKHVFAEVPPTNWHLSDYNLKPVGSGPFAFAGYDKKPDGFIRAYTVSAWNNYPGDGALVETIRFLFFSEQADLLKAFDAGKLDGFAGIGPDDASAIKRPHETIRYAIPNYYAVFLNQNKNVPLKEKDVRTALALAVDRDALLSNALGGVGMPAVGPIPEGTPYFNAELKRAADPEAAGALLDAAGWKINDLGLREKSAQKSTTSLEFTITVPQIGFLTKTAELLRQAWQKIGVVARLETLPVEEVASKAIKNRDYEALLFGNVLGKNFDLFSFWHSSQRFHPGSNFSVYNSKKADSLIESIRQNLDQKTRETQLRELQKLMAEDAPAIFLYSPDYLFVSAKNLHGVRAETISEPAERFAAANYWYLKTARVLK